MNNDDYADHFPVPLATASPPLQDMSEPTTRGKTSEDFGAYGRTSGPTAAEDTNRSWKDETGRRAPLQDTRRAGTGGGGGGVLSPPGRGASLDKGRTSADTYAYRIPSQPASGGIKVAPAAGRDPAGQDLSGRETAGRETTGRETTGRDTTGRQATMGSRRSRDEQKEAPVRGDASGVLFLLPTAPLHMPSDDKLRSKVEKKRSKVPSWIVYCPPLKKDDGGAGLLGKGVGAAKGVAGKATGKVIKGETSVEAALKRLEADRAFTDQLVVYLPTEAKDVDLSSTLAGLIPAKKQKLPTATSLLASAQSLPLKPLPGRLDASLGDRAAAMCFSLEPTHSVFTRPSFYDLPALTGDGSVTHHAPQGFKALAQGLMDLVKKETGDGGRWEVEDAAFVGDDLEHYLRLGAQEVVKVATK